MVSPLLMAKSKLMLSTATSLRSLSHFKSKHTIGAVSVTNYSVFRHEWKPDTDNRTFELIWVHIRDNFIGALYHMPRPLYNTNELINFIEMCVTKLIDQYLHATIILAGDFNQLPDDDIVQCTGLISVVSQPTRAASHLDRISVSCPIYGTVHVVKSLVRSDHNAVVAYVDRPRLSNKTIVQRTFAASPHTSACRLFTTHKCT